MVLNSTPRFVVKKRPNSVPWPNLELVKLIECQRKLATETAITWNKVKQRESQVVELIGRVLEVDHYRPILSLYFFCESIMIYVLLSIMGEPEKEDELGW